ncbi:MAG TPA: winged helix-turn-helix domain-containing protein [Blastocatellia bacterium]|jgi:Tol biopolymer transport system component/DNA-binding winged helix-turn-helix (wHTH) protein|nr:winged helix-turn-helix domain-containing protein [Blastocatellia bacterium]
MSQRIKHFYEFGPFRLDATERLLLRDGQHIPLTPKAFETLLTLVENSGRVIEKDELIKKIWPDTFVEEVNLARNVYSLRKVLGGKKAAQYIETIPKRGYRFVASVREVRDECAESVTAPQRQSHSINQEERLESQEERFKRDVDLEPSGMPDSHGALPVMPRSLASLLSWPAVTLILGLIGAVTIWAMSFRPRDKSSNFPMEIIPFTSFPNHETHAAFSPDGNQIALAWDGASGDNFDIYVKLLGAGQPLRLTTDRAADTNPAWSPDGRYIAFFRQSSESSGFYLIPALGGTERKVADVFPYQLPTQGSSQYYSPDGKFLAVADKNSPEEPFSLILVSVETGEKRKVTSPPVGTEGDSYPAWAPDGRALAFIRSSSRATTDIYLATPTGGELRQLTFDNTSILGLAWTSNGQDIVFASRRGSSIYSLWRIPATGGTPARLATIGQSVISPAISRQGDRLAYTQTLDDLNIWRLEIDSTGRGGAMTSLISSTLDDNGPDYSPDGRKIVFASNRTGGFGIWVCDHNGGNPRQLIDRGPYLTGTPRWSPEGKWIAYDSRSNEAGRQGNADIYVISPEGGQPRRLTQELAENVAPSWSRDGKWIYFGSTHSGSMQVWKVPADGGQAAQVTRHGGFEGFESTDGKYFYYAKGRAVPGIWQVPVAGGEETLLLDHHNAGYWRLWTVVEKGIYFATADEPSHPVIEFFNFATGKVAQVATLDKPISRFYPGLIVCPDRRWLLFTQMDQGGSDIMLAEGFR